LIGQPGRQGVSNTPGLAGALPAGADTQNQARLAVNGGHMKISLFRPVGYIAQETQGSGLNGHLLVDLALIRRRKN
jgi:hypothetical protein